MIMLLYRFSLFQCQLSRIILNRAKNLAAIN